MDFGKLSPHSAIDFSLATIRDYRTQPVAQTSPMRVYLGCPVWQHPSWMGRVFLPGTPSREFLAVYSRMFNAVEVNATFYKIPERSTVERWTSEVPEDFRFVVKIPRQISHDAPLSAGMSALRAFIESVQGFGSKLGMVFLQLPPHFTPNDRRELAVFCREFPSDIPLAIEFRDTGWFENREFNARAAEWFSERGVSLIVTDTTGRRDVSHGAMTSNRMMVRFLGNELHPTDYERAQAWIDRLGEWAQSGVRETYFFMHQPDEETAPDLVAWMFESLRSDPRFDVRFQWTEAPVAIQPSLF